MWSIFTDVWVLVLQKYTMEVSYLQERVGMLEKENSILQSLVREYTMQASRTVFSIASFFVSDKLFLLADRM